MQLQSVACSTFYYTVHMCRMCDGGSLPTDRGFCSAGFCDALALWGYIGEYSNSVKILAARPQSSASQRKHKCCGMDVAGGIWYVALMCVLCSIDLTESVPRLALHCACVAHFQPHNRIDYLIGKARTHTHRDTSTPKRISLNLHVIRRRRRPVIV